MSSSSKERRALAILPNWLGDLVMVAPALASLRARGPLLLLGSGSSLDLLSALGLGGDAVLYERGRERGPLGVLRAGRRAALWKPELAYAFGPSLRAAALAFASGAPERIGGGGEGRALFLNRARGRIDRREHLAAQWLAMTGDVGSPHDRLPLTVDSAARTRWSEVREREGRRNEPYLVFAAGATYGPTKRWPHFAELARRLSRELAAVPVFVGGSDPAERELAAELAAATAGWDLAGRTDLPLLAALLAEAELFVGNDSGPMHLAAAVGAPTLGIFGSSSPQWTAPLGPRAAHVGPSPVECAPCFAPSCAIGIVCLTRLAPEEVGAAALALRKAHA